MKHVYIETFGCQMNKADSENMLGLLDEIDYKRTEKVENADLVLFNTCTIREAANERFYSYIGRIGQRKEHGNHIIIGVAGCIAQDKKDSIQKRFPFVDFFFGTNNIHRLPELVKEAEKGKKVCEISEEPLYEMPELPVIRQTKVTAWVNVILGCNFNCTYCIVPQVRGRERSRSPESIKNEIKKLASEGYKEVTLLGQNVTAYGYDLSSNYSKEKAVFGHIPEDPEYSLAKLLRNIHDVDGIERIRFLTGHPYHVTDELIDTVASLSKTCEYFHIPMQHGDNNVLKRMARVYTFEKYKELTEKIKEKMPDASIASDFIVGSPGETEIEFMNTVKAVEEIEFDACITTAYSSRPNTPSASWENQIPEDVKNERLRYLNKIVNEALEKRNKKYLNTIQEILVEGPSARNENNLTGRTRQNHIVNFPVGATLAVALTGKTINVKITQTKPWAFSGEMVDLCCKV